MRKDGRQRGQQRAAAGLARFRELLAASRTRWLAGDAAGTWDALARAQEFIEQDIAGQDIAGQEAVEPDTAGQVIAGPDTAGQGLSEHHRVLLVELLAAQSVAHVRAEQQQDALDTAARCLALAAGLDAEHAGQVEVRRAVADARVSHALARAGAWVFADAVAETERQAALAELDEVAALTDPAFEAVRSRAITGALVVRLNSIDADLASGRGEAQAWIWVSRARVLSEGLAHPGTVVRQAVDLGFRTGQWERAWDYAQGDLGRHKHRNEQVSLLAKAALLAWERGLDAEARDLGRAAQAASVAVDLPWVRVYAYLGGVIAAAAGAGPLDRALQAYRRCTTTAGHRSRPNRAWLAAQVALDAGHPPGQVRAFLDRTLPDGLGYPSLHARVELALRHREGIPVDPTRFQELFEAADLPVRDAPDRARLLRFRAAEHVRAGRPVAAAGDLQRARAVLRHWPGRVLADVEEAVAALMPQVPATPAQRRVLDLLVEGWSNQDIAVRLGCSVRTVAVHVSALLRNSATASRTELAGQELRRRLLTS